MSIRGGTSRGDSNSVVTFSGADSVPIETHTFCVVCGRFGSDFVLRKSGLKCEGCVGKSANRAWARLQQRQASELLSQATARARANSGGFLQAFGESARWTSPSAMDSEETESAPPLTAGEAHVGSHYAGGAVPRTPQWRFSLPAHAEGGADGGRQPHILDYIANTACYQAAAAGVRVSEALTSLSNAADSSTAGTNDDSCMNDTMNSLVSPMGVLALRRRAPALPPAALMNKRGKSSPTVRTEEPKDEKGSRSPATDKCPDSTLSATLVPHEFIPSEKRSHSRDNTLVVVVDPLNPIESSSAEGVYERDDKSEDPVSLPPLLHSESYCGIPKTPCADDLSSVAEVSSDAANKNEAFETRVNGAAPLATDSGDGKAGCATPIPPHPRHLYITKSPPMHTEEATGTTTTAVSTSGAARRSVTPATGGSPPHTSLRSSVEGTRSVALSGLASSKRSGNKKTKNPSRMGIVVTSGTGGGKAKAQRQNRQKHHQHESHVPQSQLQSPKHLESASISREFGRSEIKAFEPLMSPSSSSSSSASYSSPSTLSRSASSQLSSVQVDSLRGNDVVHDRDTPPLHAAQQKAAAANTGSPTAPLSVNIDRLFITVDVTQWMPSEESQSSAVPHSFSPSYSYSSAMNQTTTPVPPAPGSKFTVTRHFSPGAPSRPEHTGDGSGGGTSTLITPRWCLEQKSGSVAGGGGVMDAGTHRSGTGRRRLSNSSSTATTDRVEAKKIVFIISLHDRDTEEELYSLRCRYFLDLVPVFQELKSLMNTLPPLPVLRIPSVRYVPEAFVLERRMECQNFLNAVAQNHFLVRHPKLVELLRLEPYLNQSKTSNGIMSSRISRYTDPMKTTAHKMGYEQTPSVFVQLNDGYLEQFRSSSSMGFFDRKMSTSSCMSTTSSVARRGAIDAIIKEDLEKVQLGNLIGRGTFGSVYLGLLPGHSTMVAVKIVKVNEHLDDDFLFSMRKELDVLRAARHKNIIRFLGSTYFEQERELRVFTEYVECGNISTMVKKFGSLPLVIIQKYMKQILHGLHYLHNMGIIHRDIKGENILITKKGRCKLADFGCSGTLHEVEGRKEIQGSPLWMAPEIIHGSSPAPSGDIWALGCVGIEMLQRQIWNIAGDINPYIFLYRVGKINGPPHGLPTEEEVEKFNRHEETKEEYIWFGLYRDFLSKCLQVNVEERWSAEKLLKHAFLSKPISKYLRWMPPEGGNEKSPMNVEGGCEARSSSVGGETK